MALVSGVALTSCSEPSALKQISKRYPEMQIYNDFKKSQAFLFCHQYDMKCCMIGGSNIPKHGIASVGFSVPRKLSINEGRAILIDCVHQMTNNINSYDPLKPYMIPGGFTPKNVEISLFIRAPEPTFDPEIRVFSFSDGEVCFSTYKENQEQAGFYRSEYETYEEAISILDREGIPYTKINLLTDNEVVQ